MVTNTEQTILLRHKLMMLSDRGQ